MNEIVVIGPTIVNNIAYISEPLKEKKEYPCNITSLNGSGSFEMAVNFAQLGVHTNFISRFSNDEAANSLWSKLDANSIMTYQNGFIDETAKRFIVVDNYGKQTIFNHSKANIYPDDIVTIPSIVVKKCDYGVATLLNSNFARDLFTLYPNVKWVLEKNILADDVIKLCEGITLSYQDALKITSEKDFGILGNNLLSKGCHWVLITKDNNGVYFFSNNLQKYYEFNIENQKSFLGDHELYVSLLITGLVRNYTIQEAIDIANKEFEKIVTSE